MEERVGEEEGGCVDVGAGRGGSGTKQQTAALLIALPQHCSVTGKLESGEGIGARRGGGR